MSRALALLLALVGCGGGSFYAGGFVDDAGGGVDAGDGATQDALPPVDAGLDGGPLDAGAFDADLSHCRVLGEHCEASAECACAEGGGCPIDNVVCGARATCDVYQYAQFGPDASCCLVCENNYELCGGSSRDPCFDQWRSCNAQCGGCYVGCVAPN